MEAPKCRLCGKTHWGNCVIVTTEPRKKTSKTKPEKKLPKHHLAWLSRHPKRSASWLADQINNGFHIHHMDGNHENDAPDNLLLIYGGDHRALHGRTVPKVLRKSKAKFDRVAYQREYMRRRRAK